MQTARPAEESRRIFLLIYDFLSVYIKKLHQDMGVLQCLFTSDVVEHHHEPLQFVNTFNSHVCLLPVVNFDSSLLQILCMAVYRNIFLASGCRGKMSLLTNNNGRIILPIERMNQLYFYYKIFRCYSIAVNLSYITSDTTFHAYKQVE